MKIYDIRINEIAKLRIYHKFISGVDGQQDPTSFLYFIETGGRIIIKNRGHRITANERQKEIIIVRGSSPIYTGAFAETWYTVLGHNKGHFLRLF
jgi:hypothetical protein